MPLRLVSTTAFHFSIGRSSIEVLGALMPALLNSRSTRPQPFTTASNSACTDAGSVTSVGTASPRSPAFDSSSTPCNASCRRPASATRHPLPSSASAAALPTPLPAPVTMATRADWLLLIACLLLGCCSAPPLAALGFVGRGLLHRGGQGFDRCVLDFAGSLLGRALAAGAGPPARALVAHRARFQLLALADQPEVDLAAVEVDA